MASRTVRAHALLTVILVGLLLAPLTPRHTLVGTAASAGPMSITDLGTLPGGISSFANGINNPGQVVGQADLPSTGITHAFLWSAGGGMQDLGTLPARTHSYANGINQAGAVVGYSDTAGDEHAFLWYPGQGMQFLGTLGGPTSVAQAINNAGMVVGSAATTNGVSHAFPWIPASASSPSQGPGIHDLGPLPGGTDSFANGINTFPGHRSCSAAHWRADGHS